MRYSNLHELVVLVISNLSIGYNYRSLEDGGHDWKFFFPNGRGLSVVKHDISYGRKRDLWEIAGVIHNGGYRFHVVSITENDDFGIGWLTEKEVIEYARKYSAMDTIDYDYWFPER